MLFQINFVKSEESVTVLHLEVLKGRDLFFFEKKIQGVGGKICYNY